MERWLPSAASEEAVEPRPSRWSAFWSFVRHHPVTVGVFGVGAVAGAVAASVLQLGPDDMSPVLRVLGGALLGGWLAMFPLGFRLFD